MRKNADLVFCLLWLVFLIMASMSGATRGEGIISPSSFSVLPSEAVENSWIALAPLPTARSGVEVAVANGKIYAIGGWNGSWRNTIDEYDPVTDTWATKKPMPTARWNFAIAVFQNKIYVIGGKSGANVTGANEVYDPLTDTWETKTPMPTERQHLDANVIKGKIYLIGGLLPTGNETGVNEVYDPASDSWTINASVPTGVHGYVSAVVNNRIYVIGGFYVSDLNQIYDPETDTWHSGKKMPYKIHGMAAAATTGVTAPKKIYVMGGTTQFYDSLSLNQVYDPEADAWSEGTQLPAPRSFLGLAVVNDTFYAIGGGSGIGWQGDLPTATNWQYIPFGFGASFPIALIAAAIAIVAIGVVAFLFIRAKAKKIRKTDSVRGSAI